MREETTTEGGRPEGRAPDMIRGPVPELVRRIAVPASVGFLFHTLFNVVDTWWAGRISTTAQAALSLAFPVFFLVIALGSGLSTGTTALVGQALGGGRRAEAARLAAQGMVFGLLCALPLTLAGPLLAPSLFSSLGASAEYLEASMAYMTPIFLGAIFFLAVQQANAGLQAMGDTRSNRDFLVGGCLLNLGLDPLFIHGWPGLGLPGLGVAGIAWATVLVQGLGVLWLLWRLRRAGLLRGLGARDFLPDLTALRAIAGQGLPATLNYLTIGAGIYVITWFISTHGRAAVAAYGIGTRVVQIALLPSIGLGLATLSLTAQNMGAKRFDRVFEALATALRGGLWVMLPGMAAVVLGAGPLMRLFSSDPEVIAAGAGYLRVEGLALYGYVVLYVHVAALQGAKRPLFAIWLGLFRQIAAPLAVFPLVTSVLGLGLTGLWWSIFAIVWCSALAARLICLRILRRAVKRAEQSPEHA